MACDLNDLELIDLFGGVSDYRAGLIRCVPEAQDRFLKDPLRLLRAVRQAAKFGFTIEKNTFASARELSKLIENPAPERIMSELTKLLSIGSDSISKYVKYLVELNLFYNIFKKYFDSSVDETICSEKLFNEKIYAAFDSLRGENYRLKLAFLILFGYYELLKGRKEIVPLKKTRRALFDMKFCAEDFEYISSLVFLVEREISLNKTGALENVKSVDVKEAMIDFLEASKMKVDTCEVFILCKLVCDVYDYNVRTKTYSEAINVARTVISASEPVYIEDLAIDGNCVKDILKAGAGPLIGVALKHAQRIVIKDVTRNTREYLLTALREKFADVVALKQIK